MLCSFKHCNSTLIISGIRCICSRRTLNKRGRCVSNCKWRMPFQTNLPEWLRSHRYLISEISLATVNGDSVVCACAGLPKRKDSIWAHTSSARSRRSCTTLDSRSGEARCLVATSLPTASMCPVRYRPCLGAARQLRGYRSIKPHALVCCPRYSGQV